MSALKQRGATDIVQSQGYFPDWDIKCNFGTYEIKEDVAASRTGNVFIEFTYRGKPSGIASTKADYFVFIIGDNAYFTRTEYWKDFIRDSWQYLKKVKGGDNNWSQGILLEVQYLSPQYISSFKSWELEPYEQLPD